MELSAKGRWRERERGGVRGRACFHSSLLGWTQVQKPFYQRDVSGGCGGAHVEAGLPDGATAIQGPRERPDGSGAQGETK